ncbi:MAG: M20/M25/M40 family metallo-hydrolase [Acidobacteria bacterium]|nr:M20/M25/M40 family metallo-hydrolase [Acidobacteriota bacterium]
MKYAPYFRSRQGELINLLKQLVHLESPSDNKEAVDACSSYFVNELKKCGLQIERITQKDTGDFYLCEYPHSSDPDLKAISILTHTDTVWPVGQIHSMPFYVEGEKLYGPGVSDMKAGLVMILSVLRAFKQLNVIPRRRLILFVNSAEEIPNKNAVEEIKKLARRSKYGICLEPAIQGGGLKLERKGRLVVRIETTGKSAHAGSPEQGVNAIEEMMKQLKMVQKWRTGETTVNIGVIQGGNKINVVADKASASLDIRFWTSARKEKILTAIRNLTPQTEGAGVKGSILSDTPPMEKKRSSVQFFEEVKAMASTIGLELAGGRTGGGSDASHMSGCGIPCLDGLGPDGGGIHALDEHILIPSLVERTALLAEILQNL